MRIRCGGEGVRGEQEERERKRGEDKKRGRKESSDGWRE